MGSTTKGSSNVAEALGADLAGQEATLTDDVIIRVNGDESDTTQGIYLVSNNGTVYKLSLSDAGVLSTQAV